MSAGVTLVMLAAGGTAILIGAAYLLKFDKSFAIASPNDAERFVRDYAPDVVPSMSVLSSDGQSALVACADNRVFIVCILGDGHVVRRIGSLNVTQIDEGKVRVDPKDLGFPSRYFSAVPATLHPILDVLKQGLTP